MTRPDRLHFDPCTWPAFDDGALEVTARKSFNARREAISMYAARATLAEIEARTGVDRSQLYRHIDRCLTVHSDGCVFGWRALTPWARVGDYARTARVNLSRDGAGDGGAGAFGLLLSVITQFDVPMIAFSDGLRSHHGA